MAPDYQHIALFLGGSKLRLSRVIQHTVIWTIELKRKKNQQRWAFSLAEPGRKTYFKADKFPSEVFCLVSKNLLSCFPVTSATDSYPGGEPKGWWGWGRERLGKTVCSGWPGSMRSPVGHTLNYSSGHRVSCWWQCHSKWLSKPLRIPLLTGNIKLGHLECPSVNGYRQFIVALKFQTLGRATSQRAGKCYPELLLWF